MVCLPSAFLLVSELDRLAVGYARSVACNPWPALSHFNGDVTSLLYQPPALPYAPHWVYGHGLWRCRRHTPSASRRYDRAVLWRRSASASRSLQCYIDPAAGTDFPAPSI